jgi:copper chaperone CopZ
LKTFQVLNVKCNGCATTLKNKLKEEFGEVEVNLNATPRTITLDMNNKDEYKLREKLKQLGYPMSDENLSTFDNVLTKGKSFVSCAIGKVELKGDLDG